MEELTLSPQSVQKVIGLECVESTQALARELATEGEEANTLVLACHQTKACARDGKPFPAPEGGVYFTLILRPNKKVTRPEDLSLRAMQAVCKTLDFFGLKTKIKNSQDALVWDASAKTWKKVAGAWTESFQEADNPFVLLGAGIYLNNRTGKKDAASVKQFTKQDVSKELFLDDVLDNFWPLFAQWEASCL